MIYFGPVTVPLFSFYGVLGAAGFAIQSVAIVVILLKRREKKR